MHFSIDTSLQSAVCNFQERTFNTHVQLKQSPRTYSYRPYWLTATSFRY